MCGIAGLPAALRKHTGPPRGGEHRWGRGGAFSTEVISLTPCPLPLTSREHGPRGARLFLKLSSLPDVDVGLPNSPRGRGAVCAGGWAACGAAGLEQAHMRRQGHVAGHPHGKHGDTDLIE